MYGDVIAAGIQIQRPRDEIETAGLDELGEQVKRFDPQVVVCSQPNTVEPGGRIAWVQLPLDPTQPTKICVGGRHSELERYVQLHLAVESNHRSEGQGRRCPDWLAPTPTKLSSGRARVGDIPLTTIS